VDAFGGARIIESDDIAGTLALVSDGVEWYSTYGDRFAIYDHDHRLGFLKAVLAKGRNFCAICAALPETAMRTKRQVEQRQDFCRALPSWLLYLACGLCDCWGFRPRRTGLGFFLVRLGADGRPWMPNRLPMS
jgi:hypothetical protein